jgi:hypothetical protein
MSMKNSNDTVHALSNISEIKNKGIEGSCGMYRGEEGSMQSFGGET